MKQKDDELELALASRMLESLGNAIDKAEDSRKRIKTGEHSNPPQPNSYYAEKLQFLDREIECLQTLQQKIQRKLDQNRQPNR